MKPRYVVSWAWNMAIGWFLYQAIGVMYTRSPMPMWALPYVGFYAHDTGLRDYCERREQRQ